MYGDGCLVSAEVGDARGAGPMMASSWHFVICSGAAHRFAALPLSLSLLACSVHEDPARESYLQARLVYPESDTGGSQPVEFRTVGRAWIGRGALYVEARQGVQVLQLVLTRFAGREGVYCLGTGDNFRAWGVVDASCIDVAVDAPPPCRLSHSSRRNWGYLTITRHRRDLVSGSFSFRAHDAANPAASFNVADGTFFARF